MFNYNYLFVFLIYFFTIQISMIFYTNESLSIEIASKGVVQTNNKNQAKVAKRKIKISKGNYLLTYSELMLLKKKDRYNYLRFISKLLIPISVESKKTTLEILFPKVYASDGFRCIGGGVPVPAGSASCGVQSYAGFSCEEGLEICNPLLFGVKEDNTPFCFTDATTDLCYKSIRVGIDSKMDLVFEAANQTAYNAFYRDIDNICYHTENENAEPKVQTAENITTLRHACNLVRRQTQINQERILPGAYYQSSADVIEVTPLPPPVQMPVPAIEEPTEGAQ